MAWVGFVCGCGPFLASWCGFGCRPWGLLGHLPPALALLWLFSGFSGTRKVARSAGGRERACKNCVLAVFACRDGVFGVAPGESVAPRVGLEPTTNGLTVHCSAN